MEFIHGTTLVHLKIRCWSGEKKASRDHDIKLGLNGELPPQKLLDLGRKKIFPPKAFDPLARERKAAERACLSIGTRFMGGYAIPDEDVDEIVIKLDSIKEKFRLALADFLSDFDRNKEDWLSDNVEFAHIIRDQVPDREAVEKSFDFSFTLYKMQPVEGFEPDADDVANQVLHEIGMTCKEMSNRLLDRKTAISGKKLKEQVEPLIKKLDTLSFGNGRILKVLNEFRALHNSVPLERIDQDHPSHSQTVLFLSMCADSEKLERIIDGQLSVAKLIQSSQPPAPSQDAVGSDLSTTKPAAAMSSIASAGAYF
ncbi:DUF3150 domain-containing protein [Alkalimarinus alittae]|uniref:DUF3150 domain-containing protein n=1 Tax=Alkalimarinus alittae TaxID=2961619 RepID=A0ABY6N5K7_9ALTE|nr:DUF3150 domain-containing protein [Alkalimarinus alittae]UZE97264.1 DUF3150 domain-containing protein [Alkalimarinus alittae]